MVSPRKTDLAFAAMVSKSYQLCDKCLSRQLSLPKSLGSSRSRRTMKKNKRSKKLERGRTGGGEAAADNDRRCYICGGLMNSTGDLLALMLDSLQAYQFKTFLIGATLPQKMLEREDGLRARFKVRGRESIKSDLTRELGKLLGGTTGTRVEYLRPDVNINMDLTEERRVVAAVRAKPIYLLGRYVKNVRGLKQKQERCILCRGKGCDSCSNTGLAGFDDSVEGIIVKKLIEIFGCDGAKFAWVGGEDRESLVLNEGRPFFVKVINPRARFADLARLQFEDGVKATFIREVGSFPEKPLKFRVKVRLTIECDRRVDDASLEKLKQQLRNASVKFLGKNNREVSKGIYEFDAVRAPEEENRLEVAMVADGGLTIKQFVGGDGMEPNISQLLECKLTCKHFDVLEVRLLEPDQQRNM